MFGSGNRRLALRRNFFLEQEAQLHSPGEDHIDPGMFGDMAQELAGSRAQ